MEVYIKDVCCWSKERIKIYFLIYVGPRRDLYFFNIFILFLLTCYICLCFQLVAFVREHIWHKALLMGYSMRFELTLVRSLNAFPLVVGFI